MLGPVAQVKGPGDYLAVDVAGWKLFAMHGRDGVLRASTTCVVTAVRGCWQTGRASERLRCPYHQWIYDQNGALRQAPWFGEDPQFDVQDWPLHSAAIAQWRGLLFICIDPESA